MVRRVQYAFALSLCSGLLWARPAAADGVLESLEKEVSAISGRIKSAVVMVEETPTMRVGQFLGHRALRTFSPLEATPNTFTFERFPLFDVTRSFFLQEKDPLAQEIRALYRQIAELEEEQFRLSTSQERQSAKSKQLDAQIRDAKKRLEEKKSAYRKQAPKVGLAPKTDPNALLEKQLLEEDIRALRDKLNAQEDELTDALMKYTKSHPNVRELQSRMSDLKKRLAEKRAAWNVEANRLLAPQQEQTPDVVLFLDQRGLQEDILRLYRKASDTKTTLTKLKTQYGAQAPQVRQALKLQQETQQRLEERKAALAKLEVRLKQDEALKALSDVEIAFLSEDLAKRNEERWELNIALDSQRELLSDAHPKVQELRARLSQADKGIADTMYRIRMTENGDPDRLTAQERVANRNQIWVSGQPSPMNAAVQLALRSGTGFSIGDGFIVTTADVADGMKNPVVVTDDGTRLKAKALGVHPELNVGLLKIEAKIDLPALSLGDSEQINAGKFAISVGNQTGVNNSVALLLVGGVKQEGTSSGNRFYPKLIQFAGTVGAGTSGAPLVDSKGAVIGMMVAVPTITSSLAYTVTGMATAANPLFLRPTAQTVVGEPVTSAGFAVPINDIKPVIQQLREGKPIVRCWIGISPSDVVQATERDGIVTQERSVRAMGVYPDSPASKAGMAPGDVLVQINGRPVRSSADIREASVRLRPGDELRLKILRGKEKKELELTLKAESRPETPKPPMLEKPEKEKPAKEEQENEE